MHNQAEQARPVDNSTAESKLRSALRGREAGDSLGQHTFDAQQFARNANAAGVSGQDDALSFSPHAPGIGGGGAMSGSGATGQSPHEFSPGRLLKQLQLSREVARHNISAHQQRLFMLSELETLLHPFNPDTIDHIVRLIRDLQLG